MDQQYYIDNHIGLFKNFMPNELIDKYINYFNKCEQQGAVYPRKEDEMLVSDNAIDTIRDTNVAMTYNNKPFIDMFFKDVYPLYVQKYSYLKKLATHNILEVKIQKTKVGEGYHFHSAKIDYQPPMDLRDFYIFPYDMRHTVYYV